jgi:nucleoside-diphosphate-sugar epimerase
LAEKNFPPNVEIVEGDLHDAISIEKLLKPGCTVINLAYLWHGGEAANLEATENLIAACRNVAIGRLIHCSTAAVVGRVQGNRITEETPCNPVTEYGITKLKIEQAVAQAEAQKYFDVAIVRPTAVFGLEGEQLKKLVSDLRDGFFWVNYAKSCLYGKRRMNLVHITNVMAAIIFLIRRSTPIGGGVFIVSDDDDPNNNFAYVEHFLKEALSIGEYPLPKITLPSWVLSALLAARCRNNINPLCDYDPGKLLGLGFERPISLEEGLAEYAARYRFTHHLSGGSAV